MTCSSLTLWRPARPSPSSNDVPRASAADIQPGAFTGPAAVFSERLVAAPSPPVRHSSPWVAYRFEYFRAFF